MLDGLRRLRARAFTPLVSLLQRRGPLLRGGSPVADVRSTSTKGTGGVNEAARVARREIFDRLFKELNVDDDARRDFTNCAESLLECPEPNLRESQCKNGETDVLSTEALDDSCVVLPGPPTSKKNCVKAESLAKYWANSKVTRDPFTNLPLKGPGCASPAKAAEHFRDDALRAQEIAGTQVEGSQGHLAGTHVEGSEEHIMDILDRMWARHHNVRFGSRDRDELDRLIQERRGGAPYQQDSPLTRSERHIILYHENLLNAYRTSLRRYEELRRAPDQSDPEFQAARIRTTVLRNELDGFAFRQRAASEHRLGLEARVREQQRLLDVLRRTLPNTDPQIQRVEHELGVLTREVSRYLPYPW